MPKGPRGEHRPADLIGCAVHVARIATGEAEDDIGVPSRKRIAAEAGGHARANVLSGERRKEIARAGSSARWNTKEAI
jgi:hypothetical protein